MKETAIYSKEQNIWRFLHGDFKRDRKQAGVSGKRNRNCDDGSCSGSRLLLFTGKILGNGVGGRSERQSFPSGDDRCGTRRNDPGKVGVDGVLEKDLNLLLAKKLKTLLEQQDLDVLLLREEDRGLYDENASNKKAQDMKRRCARINEEQPACVISIHQNSYHEQSVSGAQVFYYKASSGSERLGKILEKELSRMLGEENSRTAKANTTYYLLKKTEVPTVIIECGFLSSWEDCAKLQDETYQEKLVWGDRHGGIEVYKWRLIRLPFV